MDGLAQMRPDGAAVVDLIGITVAAEIQRVAFQPGRGQLPLPRCRLSATAKIAEESRPPLTSQAIGWLERDRRRTTSNSKAR